MPRLLSGIGLLTILSVVIFTSCETEEEIPTKTRMEGVWVLEEAINPNGDTVTSRVRFPICAFHLSSDGTIVSTAGPLIMYIVYGNNKYTEIFSKIDQVFNYAGFDFNGGEYFVAGGVTNRFTLEMKLEGAPGMKTLKDLLTIIGLDASYLEFIVYHKFMDVAISFNEDASEMYWSIDSETTAVYNKKDQYGNYVLWQGWPVNNFQQITMKFSKKVKDLQTLVQEAA